MMKPTTKLEKTIAEFNEVIRAGFDRHEMEKIVYVGTPTKVYKITCKSERVSNVENTKKEMN